jgi:hypothetical protein
MRIKTLAATLVSVALASLVSTLALHGNAGSTIIAHFS